MRHSIIKPMLLISMLMNITFAFGEPATPKIHRIINPSQTIDHQIGDVLVRVIEIDLPKGTKLSQDALPPKGLVNNGIELSSVDFESEDLESLQRLKLTLKYQIFSHIEKPSVLGLPNLSIKVPNSESLNVPEWYFWMSPMVSVQLAHAKSNVQPQNLPDLINTKKNQILLGSSIGLIVISLLALFYVNSDAIRLPFVGGNFAHAHRRIRKLKSKNESEFIKQRLAVSYLHQAFNEVAGKTLFQKDLEEFLLSNPKYFQLKNKINDFFTISNKILFADQRIAKPEITKQLLKLSSDLKSCERGVL